jgi:threonine/homoserine/homoserine lactone efflux protein
MLGYLVLGMTYAFGAAVQPGPLQTFLILQTLTNGWRRSIPAAFAPLISDGPIIALVIFVLIHIPAWLIQILQFSGGLFLLYLAYGAYKSWRDFAVQNAAQIHSSHKTLLKVATVNLLNPAPYIGWSLIMGPLLLKAWRETPSHGIALLVGFYATMILATLGIMLLFSLARNLGPRIIRILVGISSIALTCFGLYELLLGSGIHW